MKWIKDKELELINIPGEGTFFRPNVARETVIDLTLATSAIAGCIEDWQVVKDISSDHFGILFTIASNRPAIGPDKSPFQERFNTKLANWELFATNL